MENNIYNLGSRGYVATPGGVKENPYTFVKDLAEGKYKVPWEDEIKVKDGSIYGYPVKNDSFLGKGMKQAHHIDALVLLINNLKFF